MLPNICNIYNIRHPTVHLPLVKHDFAEQRLDNQIIKLLNTNNQQRSHLRHNLYSLMVLKPLSNITLLITMLIVAMMFIV